MKSWLDSAFGAFGNDIGEEYAAPMDLHCAATKLANYPVPGISLVKIDGAPDLPYDHGLPPDRSVP